MSRRAGDSRQAWRGAASHRRACDDADRDPAEVTLVVVTKFFPATDVRILADLGVVHVGEPAPGGRGEGRGCADLALTWHFIGGLQSNKAAAVASYADVVESVDRAKLVGPLHRAQTARDHRVDVLLQVSLDPPGRAGRSSAPRQRSWRSRRRRGGRDARSPRSDGSRAARRGPPSAFDRLAEIRAEFVVDHPVRPGCPRG